MKKTIFCANCQVDTLQEFSSAKNYDGHSEILSKCDCGREIKFPGTLSVGEFKAAIEAHKTNNIGQVKVDETLVDTVHPLLAALETL